MTIHCDNFYGPGGREWVGESLVKPTVPDPVEEGVRDPPEAALQECVRDRDPPYL